MFVTEVVEVETDVVVAVVVDTDVVVAVVVMLEVVTDVVVAVLVDVTVVVLPPAAALSERPTATTVPGVFATRLPTSVNIFDFPAESSPIVEPTVMLAHKFI